VRQGYLARARKAPERYRIIDASQKLSQVQAQIKMTLNEALKAQ